MKRVVNLMLTLLCSWNFCLAAEVRGIGDGEGEVQLLKSEEVTVSASATWQFRFTVAEEGIRTGGGIVFIAPPFWGWSPPQTHSAGMPGYTTLTVSRPEAKVTVEEVENGILVLRIKGEALVKGDTVTITYGDTGNSAQPQGAARADRFAEREQEFMFKVDGDGDEYFHPLDDCPKVQVKSQAVKSLFLAAPSILVSEEPFEMRVSALDYFENLVENYTGSVELVAAKGVESLTNGPMLFVEKDRGSKGFKLRFTLPGDYRVKVRDHRTGLEGVSNPIRVVPEKPTRRLIWGDFHGHTGYSDGTGTPDDYYRYARFVSGMNVSAVTDHDAHGLRPLDEPNGLWEKIVAAAEKVNVPDEFVAFVGYEWTSWTYGHKHVLFPGNNGKIFSFRSEQAATPTQLWNCLKPFDAMTISHHPGGGPIGQDWNFVNPEREPLVEICSIHGSSERPGTPITIYNPDQDGFVQSALYRGYRLGFTGGGDTHNGHPGMGDPNARTGGICALLVDSVSRDSVWRALQERRVYATSGPKIILEIKLNDRIEMGSVLTEIPSTREFKISALGDENLEQVELIRNNEVIAQKSVIGPAVDWTYSDTTPLSDPCFYYVRVTQQDDQCAWSSPIWLGVALTTKD